MQDSSSPSPSSLEIDRALRSMSPYELQALQDIQRKTKELTGTTITLREALYICVKQVASEPEGLQKVTDMVKAEQAKNDLVACENRAHQAILDRALINDEIIYAKREQESLDNKMVKANEEVSVARAAYEAAAKQAE